MRTIITLAIVALLGACSTPGTTTTPVSGTAAQNVGGDQGAANATESGSAVNTVTPITVNALAAQEVTVTVKDGAPEVKITANPSAKVVVAGASFGNVIFGEGAMSSKVTSGGGAAGGGDATRQTVGDQNRAEGVRAPREPRAPRPTEDPATAPNPAESGGGN